MVSQKIVEMAMEAINEPCTTRDIEAYLVQNNLMSGKWDLKTDIANTLRVLKKWEIVDRLPQGHVEDGCVVWYMVKNGDPHQENCPKCKRIDNAYKIYKNELIAKGIAGKIRNYDGGISPDEQKAHFQGYQ